MNNRLANGFAALAFLFSFSIAEAKIVKEGYEINDPSLSWFKEVQRHPELTIDHVNGGKFEVWGPDGLGAWLTKNNAPFKSLETKVLVDDYPSYEEITALLRNFAQTYPQTAKLFSIGRTTDGRELWFMKISRNVMVDDNRPEFKYIANMHGDEIVGRELMLKLIADLLQNDGRDPQVTSLLDNVQIYIMPSMNPDGAARGRRGNARNIDLNRDFPEYSRNDQNRPDGRAVETQAMMRFQATRNFKLSANFHGGAEVVNYPWDAIPAAHPDETYVKEISLDYARLAPYIYSSTAFRNGITNGYEWYEVLGGMQDWSERFYADLQLTIELSNTKWPMYSRVDYYWQQNRTALLNLIGKVTTVP